MVAQPGNSPGDAPPANQPGRPDQPTALRELILAVTREEYGVIPERLAKLLADVEDLYAGRWPTHEACEVQYHDLVHALDVTLAAARIAAGWNRSHADRRLELELFCWTLAAALFHDAGYIKDRGDREGHGGKFTVTHVPRGMIIAEAYLRRHHWPARAAWFVPAVIALTDYRRSQGEIDDAQFDQPEKIAARILPTADLIGQIGDSRYPTKIDGLFAEFQEMYDYLGNNDPESAPVPIFNSAQELRNTTEDFYDNFVAPRLAVFGHLERYLDVYFDPGKNPYRENIAANLARLHERHPTNPS